MPTALITHADCRLHDMGEHHPECPDRLGAIQDRLLAAGLAGYLLELDAPRATDAQLLRVHAAEYLDALEQALPQSGLVQVDPDTAMGPHSLRAARRAAGAGVLATETVLSGRARNAFCCVRPPGHHAERARAMGFCFYNNVAVAAAHALEVGGLERVAIADFDVHHGNGTEDIFREDPRVMMVSTFQHPLYPYTGHDTRTDRMVNIALPAGTGGGGFRAAVSANWLPALEAFRPQMVFVSAGFDAHRDDELASLRLLEADFQWVTAQLMEVASRHAGSRLVSLLEGGYDLPALGRSAVVHLRTLAEL